MFITKLYVNDNVRPCSANDSLFYAAVNEVLNFELERTLKNPGFITKLKLYDDATDEEKERLDELLNDDLKLACAYFTYAIMIRTAQGTLTKYGYTTKANDESYPAEQSKIVADSAYYKSCGDKLLSNFISKHPDLVKNASSQNWARVKIIGD